MNKKSLKKEDLAKGGIRENKWTLSFLLLIILPAAIYFWFGLQHLTQFETADEHLWISNPYEGRIQKYWYAAAEKRWENTRINDKPGVSLAFISGIGMWFENNVDDKLVRKENLWSIYNPSKQEETYRIYRLPLVIFNGILALYFFLAFWRLTKKHWLALAAASFILLSPVLIGISQIINPDTLLWSFSFAGILSFLLFLTNTRFIDGFLTALFLGLALLSKYVAILLFPFFMAMLLGYILFEYQKLTEQRKFRRKAIFISLGFLLISAGGIGVFALLMPAVLAKQGLLSKTLFNFRGQKDIFYVCAYLSTFILADAIFLKSFIVKFFAKYLQFLKIILPKALYLFLTLVVLTILATWSLEKDFLHLNDPGFNEKNLRNFSPYYQLMVQAKPLVFALTPITLFLMLFAWIKSIFRKSEFDYLLLIFSAFIAVYLLAITEMKVLVHVRYSISIFPAALAIAGIGFYEIVKRLKARESFVLLLIALFISYNNIEKIKPFYFNYASDLLPKNSRISTSWGYGGHEAVNYINSQGDPQNMKIWTNYYGVCPFFKGKCSAEGVVKWMKDSEVANFDYIVTSKPGMNKNAPGLKRINQIIATDNPEWELDIDDRPGNFIRVYKVVLSEEIKQYLLDKLVVKKQPPVVPVVETKITNEKNKKSKK